MFGPKKEVKALAESIASNVNNNWESWNKDKGNFSDPDFVSNILDWIDRNHPAKLLGGKRKQLESYWVGEEQLKDFDFTYFAKQIHEPNKYNIGDYLGKIDFENSLILAIYWEYETGVVLTNEKLFVFPKGKKIFSVNEGYMAIELRKISDISIGKGISQGKFTLNGDVIGQIYIPEDSVKELRKLLEQFVRECKQLEDTTDGSPIETPTSSESGLEKLKSLKELLDMDAITQDEFDSQNEEILKNL